jgi:hypothetical protein
MKTTPWILIIVLIILFVLQRECHRCQVCPEPTVTTSTSTIPGDPYPVPYPVVKIERHDSIIYKDVPADIDSASVAKAYYAEVYGKNRVIADDTSVFVSIDWMVTQNSLKTVKPYIQNRRAKTVINNTYVTNPPEDQKNKYYIGIGTGGNLNQFDIAPAIALVTKKDHLYTFEYQVFGKEYWFHTYWKIKW